MAIDVARAVAIVGMIAVNVGPRDSQSFAGLLYRAPLGRASLLFVLLAGLGISLLTRQARAPGGSVPTGTLLWRAALLLVGGLALQLLDHGVSVILPTYAVLFVLALPLLRVADSFLVVLTAAVTVLGPLAWIALQLVAPADWSLEPVTLTDPPAQVLHSVMLSGPYPVITWAAPFLLGMWLGRLDLADRAVQVRMVVWGAVAALGGLATARVLVAILGDPARAVGFDRLTTSVSHSQMPLWLISGAGSAVFVLGVILRAAPRLERWLRPLADAGNLALTIYVAHLLLLAVIVRPEPHVLSEGLLITAAMVVGAVVLATLWRIWFSRGPLEALLRGSWADRGAVPQRQLKSMDPRPSG